MTPKKTQYTYNIHNVYNSLLLILAILLFVCPSAASLDCEWLAKQWQEKNGGDLIFIQPLKENGAYDLGAYNGHLLNYRAGIYYDSQTNFSAIDEKSVLEWYEFSTGKKSVLFNISEKRPPFSIRWHY